MLQSQVFLMVFDYLVPSYPIFLQNYANDLHHESGKRYSSKLQFGRY
ncbi:hypothetical protein VCG_000307 [Vibrio cholerae 12129(1)]|nr:hypothetical protein VCG_000307 [Vibrio cholerae 12129(1)]